MKTGITWRPAEEAAFFYAAQKARKAHPELSATKIGRLAMAKLPAARRKGLTGSFWKRLTAVVGLKPNWGAGRGRPKSRPEGRSDETLSPMAPLTVTRPCWTRDCKLHVAAGTAVRFGEDVTDDPNWAWCFVALGGDVKRLALPVENLQREAESGKRCRHE